VHQLDIKVLNVFDARCNHEVFYICYTMDHYGAFNVFYQYLTSNLEKPQLFFATL